MFVKIAPPPPRPSGSAGEDAPRVPGSVWESDAPDDLVPGPRLQRHAFTLCLKRPQCSVDVLLIPEDGSKDLFAGILGVARAA